ncbi:MAG: serine/threonine-protein kinase, partial [Thermoanaerobaculia bacterium]|nr:serine/threonine-protein kinase [Thermoanaerobaculia bacterium]
LTMALIEGQTLDELIPQRGFSFERLLELAVPLVDALRAAHERGVVHRDLKPANVMVDGEGRLRVLDFGLARLQVEDQPAEGSSQLPTEAMTREGAVLGTYPYMSPEQVEGRSVDARTDIFSLGVLLYEMATGERPFCGDTSASLTAAILREMPPSVDEVRSDLPHHLGRILRRCLEKDPERRYQRAKDLLYELEGLRRESTAESSATVASSARSARPAKTRRGVYLTLAAVAAVLAIVVFYLTIRRPGPSLEPRPSDIRSIAVLPLDNLMNDPEQEYFVDGMTEALIASLAKLGELRVISRTSAMQYKGPDRPPLPEIARELGVDALIEGSVLRAEDRVRITAQLIDGRTDEHLWVETYDRPIEDVFAIHSEVARAVAAEVQIALSRDEASRLAAPEVKPAAQEAYLKGNYFLGRVGSDPSAAEQALRYFELAIEEDPTFARPLAGR